ncbi:hypothetical protein CEXT_45961 [Caerostris extrusa]|uniref:Uncharacterized protein n=1 Tax=Caerostris extrusa TaxID=172846 RepID=A0AAV4SXP5_CAEEX|nr:hypothetical protein CEXT_45961 [Caerostris extrusa]
MLTRGLQSSSHAARQQKARVLIRALACNDVNLVKEEWLLRGKIGKLRKNDLPAFLSKRRRGIFKSKYLSRANGNMGWGKKVGQEAVFGNNWEIDVREVSSGVVEGTEGRRVGVKGGQFTGFPFKTEGEGYLNLNICRGRMATWDGGGFRQEAVFGKQLGDRCPRKYLRGC